MRAYLLPGLALTFLIACESGPGQAPPAGDGSGPTDASSTDGSASDGPASDDLATSIDLAGVDLTPNGSTGDPCTMPGECLGMMARCITKDQSGNVWPGGYCSSTCSPAKNDPNTGVNPDCPGGNGTCFGTMPGSCFRTCTSMQGKDPCLRAQYSCYFRGCLPTLLSECDPTKPMSCPMDGGFTSDGGLRSGQTCEDVGYDPVGACFDRCDVFAQNCPSKEGCYPTPTFGEGFCAFAGNVGDGGACAYLNSCAPGLTCVGDGMGFLCRPFCGGPKAVTCKNGKKCVDLTNTVKQATVGVCAG